MIKKTLSEYLKAVAPVECDVCPVGKDCYNEELCYHMYETCEETILKWYMNHYEELPDWEDIVKLNSVSVAVKMK